MSLKFLHTSRRHSRQRGYSLVEILVAIGVMGVGLLALAQTVPLAMRGVTQSQVRTNAVEAAQRRMDELKMTDYSNLTAGSYSQTGTDFTLDWIITDDQPLPGSKRIDVSASWQTAQGTKLASLTTYRNE